jgi:predicted ATPase/DNA-binding CsgD family transcriptional regulator
MPMQPTPLIGRTEEVETILQALTVDGVRLLTLVGPAGVGKTRLALSAVADPRMADRFSDGIVLVDLAPVRVPQEVLTAMGRACGFSDTSPRPVGEQLLAYLEDRAMLLMLDNFEQVLPAAAGLSDLLGRCPSLTVLVTSRAPLQIRWEQAFRVSPLAVPDLSTALPPLDELTKIPSIALFLQRARARSASFALTEKQAPLLARLVTQLDGLPLAIELAAARLDMLSLSTLTQRLADRLELLAIDAPDLPERQQSLEAAVGWSYDLLSEREQRLFRCLGVFVGRVTLDAIVTVDSLVGAAGDEAKEERETGHTLRRLLSLAEKSLLLRARPEEPNGLEASASDPEEVMDDPEPAFGMLETVREYAWERLAAASELVEARRAHAHYFLALAEQADSRLRGPDQRAWFQRLEREQDNLRAALQWMLDEDTYAGPDVAAKREVAIRLAGALGWFWAVFGYHTETVRWLEEALARAPQGAEVNARVRALIALGTILTTRGETERGRAALVEVVALTEPQEAAAETAHTLLGMCAVREGNVPEGTRLFYEALGRWETLGDPWGLGFTFACLGMTATFTGDMPSAVEHYTAAVRALETAGDMHYAGVFHCYLGVAAWTRGDVHSAVAQVQAGLRASVAFRDRWLLGMAAQATTALVWAYAQPDPRARLLGAADAVRLATGAVDQWEHHPGGQEMVEQRARLARGEGDGVTAYREGRALTFDETAVLALHLLEEVAQLLASADPTQQLAKAGQEPAARHMNQNSLTAREVEVLRLVAQGLSSKAIGQQLFISQSTVNYHLTAVFNKLAVDTRAQAVAVAARRGLL